MPNDEYNSDCVIMAQFVGVGKDSRWAGEFTAVDLSKLFATRGNVHTFHEVRSACFDTLLANTPGAETFQITSVKIVWEINGGDGRPAAETVLKDNRLHGALLDAFFNRKGLGYLKVNYEDNLVIWRKHQVSHPAHSANHQPTPKRIPRTNHF
jgi:hypothetical protein